MLCRHAGERRRSAKKSRRSTWSLAIFTEPVAMLGAETELTREEFFDYGRRFATSYERTIAGTGPPGADPLEEGFAATGSRDGFMLGHVVSMPGDLAAIVELLVPELQRRDRFRRAYKGRTLRENLFDE